jgi:acyl carrier protein
MADSKEQAIIASLQNIRPEANYTTSNSFVSDGLLDSLDIVSLVADLERHFSIRIDGVEIVPENFDSIAAISALVRRSGTSK